MSQVMDLAFEKVTLGSLHLESSLPQLMKDFFKVEQVFFLTDAKNDDIIKICHCKWQALLGPGSLTVESRQGPELNQMEP